MTILIMPRSSHPRSAPCPTSTRTSASASPTISLDSASNAPTPLRRSHARDAPPGWDEDAGAWDAHSWVYRLSFPVRHCVTCSCETVSDTADQEDRQ